jgi:hypothetical protein
VIKEGVGNKKKKKIFEHGYIPRLLHVPVLPATPKGLTISINRGPNKN